MDTDKILVKIHPRSNWQAFDLGTRLAITWWKPLYGFWFVLAFPVFVLANLVSPEFGMLLVWWLKPLFEVGLLHILSRHIFQQNTGVKDTLKILPSLLKPIFVSSLTWRRLSLNRGFNLAVSQLEGLTGDKRSKRIRVLHRKNEGIHMWLIICVHIETFILISFLSLIMMLTPQGNDFEIWQLVTDGSYSGLVILNTGIFLGMWLMAPLYQAGSFMAYLNRRTILEGWDIELQFKAIARKLKSAANVAPVIALLLCLSLPFSPSQVNAAESVQENTAAKNTTEQINNRQNTDDLSDEELVLFEQTEQWVQGEKQSLDNLLSNAPFTEKSEEYRWEWVGWEWPAQQSDSKSNSSFFSFIMTAVALLAQFIEVILWGLLVCLVLLVLWLTRGHIAKLFSIRIPQAPKAPVIPDFIAQHTEPDKDDEDINQALENALLSHNWRKFLSLMLLSSIQVVQQQYDLELHKSNTENECLRIILLSVSALEAQYFEQLFALWMIVAWSHNTPEQQSIENLFDNWKQLIRHKVVSQ